MNVTIEMLPERHLAAVSHRGPYSGIGKAFDKLEKIAKPEGLLDRRDGRLIAVYPDDPDATPPEKLHSEAGVVLDGHALPPKTHEVVVPAGRYARLTYHGEYDGLLDAWKYLRTQWLPQSGLHGGPGVPFEIYRRTDHSRPEELETDLYMPVA